MRAPFSDRRQSERGVAVVYAALATGVLFGMTGLGIDGTAAYLVKLKLSVAADAAVMAGARSLSTGADINSQRSSAISVAQRFFDANFPSQYWGTSSITRQVLVTEDNTTHIRTVQVTASALAPLYFLRILNRQTVQVGVTAESKRRDVNVILVLDRSYSMQNANAIAPMQTAAVSFVNMFAGGRDKVGFIAFSGSTVIAFPAANTFKSASPNVTSLISSMVSGLNTGTAQALTVAYSELTRLNEPGALNVIVLFTDGIPNGVTADYNTVLNLLSPCSSKTSPKIGTMFQSDPNATYDPGPTAGVMQHLSTGVTDVGESRVTNGSGGCAFASNPANVRQDIQRIPAADLYGNLTTGYRPVNLARFDYPTQIVAASTNAADNAARWIRQDASLRPVIYVIGLGGTTYEPLDDVFMKRVANDVTSATYASSEPTGLYVYSPSSAQLQSAFQRISSEILRLSR